MAKTTATEENAMGFHIGFTGTQRGMTPAQKKALRLHLGAQHKSLHLFFHHGDCIGADAEAHDIADALGYRIMVHPPDIFAKRAFKVGHGNFHHKPYLERNHDIVDACDILIAAPKESAEVLRSGTWATIRYARKTGKTCVVLAPQGGLA